jgi:hypothetical protein
VPFLHPTGTIDAVNSPSGFYHFITHFAYLSFAFLSKCILQIPASIFEDLEKSLEADLEERLKQHERRYLAFSAKDKRAPADAVSRTAQRAVIDAFIKSSTACRKCENCNAYSPSFRKDGYTKIFMKPLAKKYKLAMHAMKKKIHVSSPVDIDG